MLIIVICFVVTIIADISWVPNYYRWKIGENILNSQVKPRAFLAGLTIGKPQFFICGCMYPSENPHEWCYVCRQMSTILSTRLQRPDNKPLSVHIIHWETNQMQYTMKSVGSWCSFGKHYLHLLKPTYFSSTIEGYWCDLLQHRHINGPSCAQQCWQYFYLCKQCLSPLTL